MLLWQQNSESTSANFRLSQSKNSEINSSSGQVALQEEAPQENARLESKTNNRKEPRFTAVGRLKNLECSDMGIETIAKIKKSLASGFILSKPREDADPIKTIEEAFGFMNVNVNMAYVPKKYLEDDDAFYFSGGITSGEVLDFSSGIAVNKKNKTITSWEFSP